jgi:hypothetical protein
MAEGTNPKHSKTTKAVKMLVNGNGQLDELCKFYDGEFRSRKNASRELIGIKIDWLKFHELLFSFGIERFDVGKETIFIRKVGKVIEEVQIKNIRDEVVKYIEGLPEKLDDEITREMVHKKIIDGSDTYFSKSKLEFLKGKEDIIFNSDTADAGYFYYLNGFVKCTAEGWELHDYKELQNYIWKEQIINREFIKKDYHGDFTMQNFGEFATFIFNVSGKNVDRFHAVCSLLGYLLHDFVDTKLKAIAATDSKISEEASGRTGKSLIGMALEKMRNVAHVSGKDFDPQNKFKYQNVDRSTQIIFLNDLRSKFRFECLYNDITEGVNVEKKGQDSFIKKAKIYITSNKTLDVEGDSSADRVVEFELSDHYSAAFSPKDEFKHWLFRDWSNEQWNDFDNFMMYCVQNFIGAGIETPAPINLKTRKLMQAINNEQFIEFMETEIEEKNIVLGQEFKVKEVFERFLQENPELSNNDRWSNQRNFTVALEKFAKHSDKCAAQVYKRKSGPVRYMTIFPASK